MDQKFTKEERLTSKILISKLFDEGKKMHSYPFRILTLINPLPCDYPVQLLISVPRSQFRRAADRNRIKRLIRESYRRNKHMLYEVLEKNSKQMLLCIQYTSKEMPRFQTMQEKIIVLLQRLRKEHEEIAG
jgi:ribonuclease P protein component